MPSEDLHALAPTRFPDGIPCWGVPPASLPLDGLRYEQDRHGRYLVGPAGVLATITGATGLEAQRIGAELAAAPAALDAIGYALDDLDALAMALAAHRITCGLLAEIRATLIAALALAGRDTERYHSRAGAPPRPA